MFETPGHDHGHCIDSAIAKAQQSCAARGRRLTPLRRRVLELVWLSHRPVGAYEVLDALRRERPKAAPPTVYRALEFLLDLGLVHRIESLNAYVGCSGPQGAHEGAHASQFLICSECGVAAEIADGAVQAAIGRIAAAEGFQPRRLTVEVAGRCPRCRAGLGAAS